MSDIQLEERKFIPFVLPAIVFIIAAIILIHYFYTRIYGKFYKNGRAESFGFGQNCQKNTRAGF